MNHPRMTLADTPRFDHYSTAGTREQVTLAASQDDHHHASLLPFGSLGNESPNHEG